MSTPFKMKGITPLKHLVGKHPSKKDGHKRSDHKVMKVAKKAGKKAGKSGAESLKFLAEMEKTRRKGWIPKAGDFKK